MVADRHNGDYRDGDDNDNSNDDNIRLIRAVTWKCMSGRG